MLNEEKRHFKRYKGNSECEVTFGKTTYKGRVIDYSDGIGAVFKDAPQLTTGTKVDIKVFDPKMEFKGEVKWVEQTGDEIRAGFSRMGSLQGSLKNFALADILIGLQRSTRTGVLRVESDPIFKEIFIKNGDMVYAFSNNKDDGLAEVLLREKKISPEQYKEVDTFFKEKGGKLGKILVELGYLKPKEVFNSVRHQIEEIIQSVFAVEDGEFRFIEGPLPAQELITFRISASNIIYQGIKRLDSIKHIKKAIPSPNAVLTLSPSPLNIFQNVVLDEQDRIILSNIDGIRPLEAILTLSASGETDTLKSICALLSLRIIMLMSEESVPAEIQIEDVINKPAEEVTSEFIEKVEDLVRICDSLEYYELLGIEREASAEEINKAFYKVSKEFHPDRHFSIASDDLKVKLTKIFNYIDKAYTVLSDPGKKAEYDRTLSPDAMELPKEIADDFIISEEDPAKLAKEKAAQEKAEMERLAREKAVKEEAAAAKAEKERLAREKAVKEEAAAKAAKEKAEKERVAKEKAAKEAAAAKAEKERLAREEAAVRAEKERLAKEKAVRKERAAKEKAAAKAAKEKAAREKTAAKAAVGAHDNINAQAAHPKKSRSYIPAAIAAAVILAVVLVFAFKDSGDNEIATATVAETISNEDSEKLIQAQNNAVIENELSEPKEAENAEQPVITALVDMDTEEKSSESVHIETAPDNSTNQPEQENSLDADELSDEKSKTEGIVSVFDKETPDRPEVDVVKDIPEKPENEIKPEIPPAAKPVQEKKRVPDKALFARYEKPVEVPAPEKSEPVVPDISKAKPVSKQKTIFKPRGDNFMRYKEQFNNNAGKWETYNMTMASARIENGKYYIKNKSRKSEHIILHYADFPQGREFIIKTAIKTEKASDNHSYGFVFGAKDAGNNYVFHIIGDEFYSIKKYQKGISQQLAGGRIENAAFRKDAFNILKMERQGDTIVFSINNDYLDEVSGISFFGKRIGFLVKGNSEIAVDYTRSQVWLD